MQLRNTFTINAPVDDAWEVLNTPEIVAPCFPGATLTEYEGDQFAGTVKIKLGPISMVYKGRGVYVTRDKLAHTVVIEANGRDSRGNGSASATVTASLSENGPAQTLVTILTDMKITGRPAQLGRNVINDVADRIISQFAAGVAAKIAQPTSGASASTPAETTTAPEAAGPNASTSLGPSAVSARTAPTPTESSIASPATARPLDELDLAGVLCRTTMSMFKRHAAALFAAVALLAVLAACLGRKR
jgi:carbon monoxide dehydrogenase subunit G